MIVLVPLGHAPDEVALGGWKAFFMYAGADLDPESIPVKSSRRPMSKFLVVARLRRGSLMDRHVDGLKPLKLGGRIDFEDMILMAANYADTGRYVSPFGHILVDEFQDISQSRAKLVKALKAQHPDVRMFAVGDDWQSIFRFAGSDIHLMRNFGTEFGGTFDNETGIHMTVDLGRTFRSVDQIAFAARTIVLRNPAQIEKQILPAGTATEPAIRVVLTPRDEEEKSLSKILTSLSAALDDAGKTARVLLLGRYRFLEPDVQNLRRRFPRLRIDFKTIHASKGDEADHVVLLNADSGRTGFASRLARANPRSQRLR